jgi:hypothetical protein
MHKKSCKPSKDINNDNLLTFNQTLDTEFTEETSFFGYDSDDDATCPKCKKDWNERLRFCPFCELPQYSIDNESIRHDIYKSQILVFQFQLMKEWIPFNSFDKIELFLKEDFGNISKAWWNMGPLDNFDPDNHKISRKPPQWVYLITIPEYCLMSSTIEVEGKMWQLMLSKGYMIMTWCFDVFGYTKNTVNGTYFIVIRFDENFFTK